MVKKQVVNLFFSKESKLSLFVNQKSEILYMLFLLCVHTKDYQNILKIRCWPPTFTSH